MLAGLLLFIARRKRRARADDASKPVPEVMSKPQARAKTTAGVMDTAKIQSTGGAESPMRTGNRLVIPRNTFTIGGVP